MKRGTSKNWTLRTSTRRATAYKERERREPFSDRRSRRKGGSAARDEDGERDEGVGRDLVRRWSARVRRYIYGTGAGVRSCTRDQRELSSSPKPAIT